MVTDHRILVIQCPDWTFTAAGISPETPAAAIDGGLVVACSAAAREAGVVNGMRRRDAQRICPSIVELSPDPVRDIRVFEPIAVALELLIPRVELLYPGICAIPISGAVDYYGGEAPLLERVIAAVNQELRHGAQCRAGIADSVFAAWIAAQLPDSAGLSGTIVPPGKTAEFLAPQPISTLNATELVDILLRLGIRTLGQFAALPANDVLARFGVIGMRAHQQAIGATDRPLAIRNPPQDLVSQCELDPPVRDIDTIAFHVKALADEFHQRLTSHQMGCSHIRVEAETTDNRKLSRLWRHDGFLTSISVAERVRWQLESWLTAAGNSYLSDVDSVTEADPDAGFVILRLIPDGISHGLGQQLSVTSVLDSDDIASQQQVERAVARVQGMLGLDAVICPIPHGGRSPHETVTWVPWDIRDIAPALAAMPWPGKIPQPSPAQINSLHKPALLIDHHGDAVQVSGRHEISAPPSWLVIDSRHRSAAVGWAGPWPVDEKWWDPAKHRRHARLQVTTESGEAWLLSLSDGRWWIEACYD